MKKTILLLITVLMLFTLAGCGNKPVSPEGTEDQPESTITLPKMGIAFDLPLSPDDLKGVILYSDASEVGGGVYQGRLAYCAIGADRYVELIQKKQLSEEEREIVNRRIVTLVGVVVMDGNRPRSDLEQVMGSYGYDSTGLVELGTAGEYRFFCQVNPEKDYLDSYYIFDEDYFREEFDWLANMLEDTSIIRLFEPNREGKDFTGNTVSFETVDIDGNKVSSADIFSKHKLTMVNIWGTFCGPCIREMPDLEELRARL